MTVWKILLSISVCFLGAFVFIGIPLAIYLDLNEKKADGPYGDADSPVIVLPETAVEIWTDEVTGYRFAVAKHRWKGGVGICLIPDFKKEDEEYIEVPQPRILDSRADVSFERK